MYNSPEEIYIGEEEDSSFTAIESRAFATLLSLSLSFLCSFFVSIFFRFFFLYFEHWQFRVSLCWFLFRISRPDERKKGGDYNLTALYRRMYSFIYSDDDLPYHSTLYCRRSLKSLKCYPWVLLISDTTLAGSTLLLYLHKYMYL